MVLLRIGYKETHPMLRHRVRFCYIRVLGRIRLSVSTGKSIPGMFPHFAQIQNIFMYILYLSSGKDKLYYRKESAFFTNSRRLTVFLCI